VLLTTHIRRRHYRVLVTDGRILGVEQRVAILHGQRAPLVYWKRVWRVGRPAWPFLLPVLEDARRQLLPKIRFAAVDDIDAIKTVGGLPPRRDPTLGLAGLASAQTATAPAAGAGLAAAARAGRLAAQSGAGRLVLHRRLARRLA